MKERRKGNGRGRVGREDERPERPAVNSNRVSEKAERPDFFLCLPPRSPSLASPVTTCSLFRRQRLQRKRERGVPCGIWIHVDSLTAASGIRYCTATLKLLPLSRSLGIPPSNHSWTPSVTRQGHWHRATFGEPRNSVIIRYLGDIHATDRRHAYLALPCGRVSTSDSNLLSSSTTITPSVAAARLSCSKWHRRDTRAAMLLPPPAT